MTKRPAVLFIPLLIPLATPLLSLGCWLTTVGSGHPITETRDVAGATSFEQASFFETSVRVADGPASLTLTCDDNLLPDVITTVDASGRLVLRNRTGTSLLPRTPCHAELQVPELSAVTNSGSGDIELATDVSGLGEIEDTGSGNITSSQVLAGVERIVVSGSGDIDLDEVNGCTMSVRGTGSGSVRVQALHGCDVTLASSGSGGLELAGDADSATVTASGSGSIEASAFVVGRADITMSGSGDVQIAVQDALDLVLTGSGSAFIHGNPAEHHVDDTGSGDVHFL